LPQYEAGGRENRRAGHPLRQDGLRPWDPITARLWVIRRLLEKQTYIHAVRPHNGEHIDFDASMFRDWGLPYGVTLAQLQARWLGLEPDLTQPWLSVEPEEQAPIVVARSPRYQNHWFPWKELVGEFGKHMHFVGLEPEYDQFCHECGHVARLRTNALYDVARAIAGSQVFIGNQSSPFAIAEGLKHRVIQETSLCSPDCIFHRPEAIHCYDGELDVEILGQEFTNLPFQMVSRATLSESPPNGWRVRLHGLEARSYAFDIVLDSIKTKLVHHGHPIPTNLRELIIDQSSVDMPPPPPMVPIQQLQKLVSK
jgi:hypothetical protein